MLQDRGQRMNPQWQSSQVLTLVHHASNEFMYWKNDNRVPAIIILLETFHSNSWLGLSTLKPMSCLSKAEQLRESIHLSTVLMSRTQISVPHIPIPTRQYFCDVHDLWVSGIFFRQPTWYAYDLHWRWTGQQALFCISPLSHSQRFKKTCGRKTVFKRDALSQNQHPLNPN